MHDAWFAARVKHEFDGGYTTPAISLLSNLTSTLTSVGQFYNVFEPSTAAPIIGG